MTIALPSKTERVASTPQVGALPRGIYPATIQRARTGITRDAQAWKQARLERGDGATPYQYLRVTFRIDGGDEGMKTMSRNFSMSPEAWPITEKMLLAAGYTQEDLDAGRIDEMQMVGNEVKVELLPSFQTGEPDNFLRQVFAPDADVSDVGTGTDDGDLPALT